MHSSNMIHCIVMMNLSSFTTAVAITSGCESTHNKAVSPSYVSFKDAKGASSAPRRQER